MISMSISPRKMSRIRLAWSSDMIDAGMVRVGARRHLVEEQVEAADEEPEDQRTGHRAEDPCRATDQQDRVGEERRVGREVRRGDVAGRQARHDAGEGTDDTAEHQRLHLVGVDVLAEAAHGVLVLTDALEDATPGAPHQQEDEPAEQEREGPADDHDEEVVRPEVQPEEVHDPLRG